MAKEILAGAVSEIYERSLHIGFATAVTKATQIGDSNCWMLFIENVPVAEGRLGVKRPFSALTESALMGRTHDQLDAAHMRLCLSPSDVIRRMYLEGR